MEHCLDDVWAVLCTCLTEEGAVSLLRTKHTEFTQLWMYVWCDKHIIHIHTGKYMSYIIVNPLTLASFSPQLVEMHVTSSWRACCRRSVLFPTSIMGILSWDTSWRWGELKSTTNVHYNIQMRSLLNSLAEHFVSLYGKMTEYLFTGNKLFL